MRRVGIHAAGPPMKRFDVVVIGAGTNGLAAAAVLARQGRKVLVVERRDAVGGTNATEEFHAGFRANTCRDDPGWIPAGLAAACGLDTRRLGVTHAPVGLVAVGSDNVPLAIAPDPKLATEALRERSPRDAGRWGAFANFVGQASGVLAAMYRVPPPRIQGRAVADMLALVSTGRRLRALGRRAMMEVIRALPMPVADLADEWFTSPALQAALATCGIRDVMHGPLSSGTAFVLFHEHVGSAAGHVGVRRVVRGGTGALPDALAAAARTAGAELRFGVEVSGILVRDGTAYGARLRNGDEVVSGVVISSADPRRTMALVDAGWLDPELLTAVDNIRMRGASARVHFALDALPDFPGVRGRVAPPWLGGTIVLADGPCSSSVPMTRRSSASCPPIPRSPSPCRHWATRGWRPRIAMSCRRRCTTCRTPAGAAGMTPRATR